MAYDLSDLQMTKYVADGLKQLEAYLANWAAFDAYLTIRECAPLLGPVKRGGAGRDPTSSVGPTL